MWTADQVCITDGLRVWALPDAEPGLRVWTRPQVEPGTVDLASALTPSGPDPAVRVDFESGWSVIVTATTLTTRHPRTGP